VWVTNTFHKRIAWLDPFAYVRPKSMWARPSTSRAGTIPARHVLRRPTEQQHEIAGVGSGEFPLVGEAVPPPVRVQVRYAGGATDQLESDLDAVRS
jgi:hypothetical protein